jgi:hypothetical protein
MVRYRSIHLWMKNVLDKNCRENQKPKILSSLTFPEDRAVYNIQKHKSLVMFPTRKRHDITLYVHCLARCMDTSACAHILIWAMYVLTCMYDFVFAYVDGWMDGWMNGRMHAILGGYLCVRDWCLLLWLGSTDRTWNNTTVYILIIRQIASNYLYYFLITYEPVIKNKIRKRFVLFHCFAVHFHSLSLLFPTNVLF